jgi:GAF domain-containing protein
MAQDSASDLECRLAQAQRELTEAREQLAATSEVLRVISSSSGELEPVFQAMLERATRICEAHFGVLFRFNDDFVEATAMLGVPPTFAEFLQSGPFIPDPGSGLGRVARTKQAVHILDARAEQEVWVERDPYFVTATELSGTRTLVVVPMLNEHKLVGAIAIYRQEVRAFSEKQIELVTNFANQAVIAIENVRLFDEVQERTRELSEALEQQTATSEVLGVISRSPGQLEPVFQAMLENAVRICEAKFGALYLSEGDAVRMVATSGVSRKLDKELRSAGLRRPGPRTALGRVIATKHTAHVVDALNEPGFFDVKPDFSAPQLSLLAGARTLVAVPLLKEGTLVGARLGRSPISRSSWSRTSPPRQSSPSRIRGC